MGISDNWSGLHSRHSNRNWRKFIFTEIHPFFIRCLSSRERKQTPSTSIDWLVCLSFDLARDIMLQWFLNISFCCFSDDVKWDKKSEDKLNNINRVTRASLSRYWAHYKNFCFLIASMEMDALSVVECLWKRNNHEGFGKIKAIFRKRF